MVWRFTSRPSVAQAIKAGNLGDGLQPVREQAHSGRTIGLRQPRIGHGLGPALVNLVTVNASVRHKRIVRCQVSGVGFEGYSVKADG